MADFANSKETRNKKVEEEMRKFNEKWTFEYFLSKMQTRVFDLQSNCNVNRIQH